MEYATLANGDKVPRYIYRYLPINDNLITSVKEGYLWFTDPQTFNDPYDCNLKTNNNISPETIKAYLIIANKFWNVWDEAQLNERINHFEKKPEEFKSHLEKELKSVAELCGVCCFSEERDLLLMWSHYATKHEGVCLKFDMKFDETIFQNTSLVKVKYPETYPDFDFLNYVISNNGNPVGKELIEFAVGKKSQDWAYEKEIRLVRWKNYHKSFRDKIYFKKEAVVGISFGYKTDLEKAKEVVNEFKDNGYTLSEINKSDLREKEFGLVFTDFTF